MPRIIAGQAGGTQLAAPPGRDTRPTADRTKEALFSILLPRLPGARFLDIFAGSGQVGLEALSRGAEAAVLVERERKAVETIRTNIARTHFEAGARVLPMEAAAAVRRLAAEIADGKARPFDVIFLDPPYADAIAWLEKLAPLMTPAPQPDEATPQPDEATSRPDEATQRPDDATPQPASPAPPPPAAPAAAGLLAPGGILVLEHESRTPAPPNVTFLQLARSCKYGTAMLSFYQNRQEDS